MNYQDSKKFYKDQWRNPFGRMRKMALPILISVIAALLIGGVSLALIPYFAWESELSNAPLMQLATSVAIGTVLTLISFKLRIRRNTHFQLIKVKISSPRRSHD